MAYDGPGFRAASMPLSFNVKTAEELVREGPVQLGEIMPLSSFQVQPEDHNLLRRQVLVPNAADNPFENVFFPLPVVSLLPPFFNLLRYQGKALRNSGF